ncbi:MAG: DUF397 domain-containing protein [Thermocrispum sp.]
MKDLYSAEIDGLTFVKACASQTEICVEVAAMRGGGWAIRDSKNPGAGILRFTDDEIREFLSSAPEVFGLSVARR